MWRKWTFFNGRLILWFQVVVLRKIKDVTSVDLSLWRIDFMILCWNVEENYRCLKLTRQQWTLTLDQFYDFFVEMSSSVDPPTHELNPEWFLRFHVEMANKLFELDPGWFYDFELTFWGKLIEREPWLILRFQVENKICWKLIHKQLTLTLKRFYDFKLKYWGK